MIRALALLLTVLTGFTGLVYEVSWQKYLATLLGSHSEATASVLGIFLGGLSLGYWLFGVVTDRLVARARARARPPRLLLSYGLVEASIGLYALCFPWLFQAIRALSYAIPHGPGGVGFAIDVMLSIVLIGTPTVLMGGTIPILTQALARSLEDATRFHAFVYAFNTAGAFAGALAAGFVLVPWLGLEGVSRSMGVVNVGCGVLFVLLGVRGRAVVDLREEGGDAPLPPGFARYALVAALLGFAMMAFQTIAIRLAGLAFGSSPFTFSMVVAVFVLCIALGSFAVSALSDIRSWFPAATLWLLGAMWMALYPFLNQSPFWAHLVRTVFRDDPSAFAPYMLLCFLSLLVVVGPPALVSGATLPLLFHDLRRRVGHLGRMAGALYSWNTVGSLAGALLGGYALLFWLDLHHVYRIATAAVFLGAALLTLRLHLRLAARAALPLAAAAGFGLLWLGPWNPDLLTLGLFRSRQPDPRLSRGVDAYMAQRLDGQGALVFHTDDPNSTVTVRENRGSDGQRSLSIWTNGKADSETRFDRQTMVLTGILPAMMVERFERAFVVGYATGVTAGELAALDSAREVVVAEISPGVMEAAPLFDFTNLAASSNPRIRVVIGDAYRALMRSEGGFDVISSEPSNPWVAGVEMLYSREFLEAARDRLSPDGVFCQWIHQYEIDEATLDLVLRTYASVFESVSVWTTLSSDLLLLGFRDGERRVDPFQLAERARRPEFARALARADVDDFAALLAHEVMPQGVLRATERDGPLHTLLHPRLADLAGRAFFLGQRASLPFTGFGEPARIGAHASLLRGYELAHGGTLPEPERAALVREACRFRRTPCAVLLAEWQLEAPDSRALATLRDWAAGRLAAGPAGRPEDGTLADPARLAEIAELLDEGPAPDGPTSLARARRASADYRSLYTHAHPFAPERLRSVWSRCRSGEHTERVCREQAARFRSREVLASPDEVEAVYRRCRSAATAGPACRAGAKAAEALLAGSGAGD